MEEEIPTASTVPHDPSVGESIGVLPTVIADPGFKDWPATTYCESTFAAMVLPPMTIGGSVEVVGGCCKTDAEDPTTSTLPSGPTVCKAIGVPSTVIEGPGARA